MSTNWSGVEIIDLEQVAANEWWLDEASRGDPSASDRWGDEANVDTREYSIVPGPDAEPTPTWNDADFTEVDVVLEVDDDGEPVPRDTELDLALRALDEDGDRSRLGPIVAPMFLTDLEIALPLDPPPFVIVASVPRSSNKKESACGHVVLSLSCRVCFAPPSAWSPRVASTRAT